MKPAITMITIGVDDLDAALRFYRDGLGFPSAGIVGEEFEHSAVAFFELQHGLRLALWPRTGIAQVTGLSLGPVSPAEMTPGYKVSSKEAVDCVMAKVGDAWALIVKPAHAAFRGGCSGYFQDPDGHLWEVV